MTDTIQEIKHSFFAYRNGIIADTLRPVMPCYKVIFGLQVPQLAQIARETPQTVKLAETLWADKGVRESRLLAAYLFDPDEMSVEHAFALAAGVQTQEEADMLAFRLFKRMPGASELLVRLERESAADAGSRSLACSLRALRAHMPE